MVEGQGDYPKFISNITRKAVPCWHEFSYDSKSPAILLRVHRTAAEEIGNIDGSAPLVKSLAERFHLTGFLGELEGDFGFNGVLKNQGLKGKGEFREYSLSIPVIKKETGRICDFCGGSGRNCFEEKCFNCEGTGNGSIVDFQEAYACSASLTILTNRLRWGHSRDTKISYPQILTIETVTNKEMNGGALSGEIDSGLRYWLGSMSSRGIYSLPEVITAMKRVYSRMFGVDRNLDFSFKMNIGEKGGLHLDCPGTTCGIDPNDWIRDGQGYGFSSHNVDSPAQQLTLIAGLAALCDKAREEMNLTY